MCQQNLTILEDDDTILVGNRNYNQPVYDDLIDRFPLPDVLNDDQMFKRTVERMIFSGRQYQPENVEEWANIYLKTVEVFGNDSNFSFIDDSSISCSCNNKYTNNDGKVNYSFPDSISIKTDVDNILTKIQPDLIAIVKKAEQESSESLIGKLNDKMLCWMSYLLQNIPIYNVSKEDFDKVTNILKCCDEPYDVLGYYRGHDFVSFLPNQDNPKIVICYEKIRDNATNLGRNGHLVG